LKTMNSIVIEKWEKKLSFTSTSFQV